MPVVAIGVAIVADVAAGAAIAGTVGGIAAISAVTAFEVVAAVGATLGAIGVVTKNKTLAMVGGAIGLVGGLGGLASSAGLLGEAAASGGPIFGAAPAASTADTAASAAGGFAEGLTPATAGTTGGAIDAGTFGGETAGMSVADAASSGTIDSVQAQLGEGLGRAPEGDLTTLSSVTKSAAAPDPAADVLKSVGENPTTDTAAVTNTSTNTAGDLINPPPAPPNNLGTTDPLTGQNVTSAIDPATGKIVSMPDESKGVFGKILDFANNNKTLVSGAMTVGGKLLEGAFSTVTPAQVAALNAQAAANNAAAEMAQQQRTNLAMPKAVATLQPVTGTPGPIIPPRPPGFINQQPLAPITGSPA